LEKKTRRLVDPIIEALQGKKGCLQRCGSMLTLFLGLPKVERKTDLDGLDGQLFALFFRTLFERGIYIPPSPEESWFVSSVHTDQHLDYTAEVVCRFIAEHL
jgi:glutamate-1-semialdehyde 2,1-aminomutase